MRRKKTWWARIKVCNALDRKAAELAAEMELADGEELDRLEAQLDKIVKLRETFRSNAKIPKEIWVEVLKIVGVAAVLGAVMVFETRGHVLPKNLDKWIPGPRL